MSHAISQDEFISRNKDSGHDTNQIESCHHFKSDMEEVKNAIQYTVIQCGLEQQNWRLGVNVGVKFALHDQMFASQPRLWACCPLANSATSVRLLIDTCERQLGARDGGLNAYPTFWIMRVLFTHGLQS